MGAGIGDVCCASLPTTWQPGVHVLVRWNMPENGKYIYKEQVVEIEKYDEPGTIYLHFSTLMTGCAPQPVKDSSSYGANVGIVNHTAQYIHSASVNGAGGANMGAWGAGMGNVCCASVPTKWHPELQVVVLWDVPKGSKHVYKEKIVKVEKYDEGPVRNFVCRGRVVS